MHGRTGDLELQAMFDNAPLAMLLLDGDRRVRRANRAAEQLTGSGEEALRGTRGGEALRCFHALSAPDACGASPPCEECPLRRNVLETFETGRVHDELETSLPLRSGGEQSLLLSTARLEIEGEPLVLVFIQDITERKALERERERYLERIKGANETKDVFLNTLSHELRTPLAAMMNAVEILRAPGVSPEQRAHMLDVLERNVRHQTRLIEDLFDVARVTRGKMELSREAFDLCELCAAQGDAVRPSARKAGVTLSLELPGQPVPIIGDPVRLGQIISNLLDNAVKFTDAGGSIALRLAIEDGRAMVRVRDSGAGIAPDLLPHIFEPFRQGETSLARSRGGLGLGLAVARSLAALHEGSLQAQSDGVGRGAELTLQLPLRTPAATGVARIAAGRSTTGRRVLIVEDDADLRETLSVMLRLMGHVVQRAATARSALELARKEPPEVALVDIGLPDLDGYQLARCFREDALTAGVRLVALTGYAGGSHRAHALEAGFDAYLAKPVAAPELQRVLAGEAAEPCER